MRASRLQKVSDINLNGPSRKRPAATQNEEAPQEKRTKHVVEKVRSSRQPNASQCTSSNRSEKEKSRQTSTFSQRKDGSTDADTPARLDAGNRFLQNAHKDKRDSEDELYVSDISSDAGFQTQSTYVPWLNAIQNGKSGENFRGVGRIDKLVSDAAVHYTSVSVEILSDDPGTASQTIVASSEITQIGGFEKEAVLKDKTPAYQNDKPVGAPKDVSTNALEPAELSQKIFAESDDEFADSDLERTLTSLPSGILEFSHISPRKARPGLDNTPKLQWLPPKIYTPAKTPSELSPCRSATAQASKPLPTIQSPEAPRPFIRGAFPEILADRSPVHGLQNTTILRTCFRIGEAIRASASAQRSKLDAVIELYARVMTSHRDPGPNGCKQYLELCDLFTEKPPYLHGTYTLWRSAPLWDQKSQVFLHEEGKGKMCRVIGRIKKIEPATLSPKRDMVILSISETTWSEVKWVRGIVDA